MISYYIKSQCHPIEHAAFDIILFFQVTAKKITHEQNIRISTLNCKKDKGESMDNQLITVFIGIIALCMVIITLVLIAVGLQTMQLLKRINELSVQLQHELSLFASKVAHTLQEINALIIQLKSQSHLLSQKALEALHESHEMIGYIHDQTKSLAVKASGGIAKVTMGSLIISALSQLLKKKSN